MQHSVSFGETSEEVKTKQEKLTHRQLISRRCLNVASHTQFTYKQMIKFELTKTDLDKIAVNFPDAIISEEVEHSLSHHPLLHVTRAYLEHDAISMLYARGVRSILDIGGNPTRAYPLCESMGIDYHSCNPIMSSEDIVRNARFQCWRGGDLINHDVMCNHRVEECSCTSGDLPDALLSVHSIYYLSPKTIRNLLLHRCKRHTLFAVLHRFERPYGNIPEGTEESVYDVGEDGSITMQVKGNSGRYTHPNLTWLELGSANFNDGNPGLVWYTHKSALGSEIVEFALGSIFQKVGSWVQKQPGLITGKDFRELFATTDKAIPTEFMSRDVSQIYMTPGFFVVEGADFAVHVPRLYYETAYEHLMGKNPSDKVDNWRSALAKVRGRAGQVDVASRNMGNAILWATAFAYVDSLKAQAKAMHYIRTHDKWGPLAWFDTRKYVKMWWFIAASIFFLIISIAISIVIWVISSRDTPNVLGLSSDQHWWAMIFLIIFWALLVALFVWLKYKKLEAVDTSLVPYDRYRHDPKQIGGPSVGWFKVQNPDSIFDESRVKTGYSMVVSVDAIVPHRPDGSRVNVLAALDC
jgi:hypothetical protein